MGLFSISKFLFFESISTARYVPQRKLYLALQACSSIPMTHFHFFALEIQFLQNHYKLNTVFMSKILWDNLYYLLIKLQFKAPFPIFYLASK